MSETTKFVIHVLYILICFQTGRLIGSVTAEYFIGKYGKNAKAAGYALLTGIPIMIIAAMILNEFRKAMIQ